MKDVLQVHSLITVSVSVNWGVDVAAVKGEILSKEFFRFPFIMMILFQLQKLRFKTKQCNPNPLLFLYLDFSQLLSPGLCYTA